MKQVVISVLGGVAELAYASEHVEVTIVDFDNAKAEGKSGAHQLRYWIARAKRAERASEIMPGIPDKPTNKRAQVPDLNPATDAAQFVAAQIKEALSRIRYYADSRYPCRTRNTRARYQNSRANALIERASDELTKILADPALDPSTEPDPA